MIYELTRKLLFNLPEEKAHELALLSTNFARFPGVGKLMGVARESFPVKAMGLDFPNPIGLAAGMDKNADHLDGLGNLGFGFIEVGTVTPKPQLGNPRPRLFRLPEHQAIINRMGFNNKGVDHLVEKVSSADYQGILGINIGKNKDTPNENALSDYLHCLDKVYPLASYITINISSPNTAGLRELQSEQVLAALLVRLKQRQGELADASGRYVPLVVKVAPDLESTDIAAMAEVISAAEMDGVIATNTTISRDAIAGHPLAGESGGLSGKPLFQLSTQVLESFVRHLDKRIPVIGSGGVNCAEDAQEKMARGAALVQIFSGFVYHGPALIGACIRQLG